MSHLISSPLEVRNCALWLDAANATPAQWTDAGPNGYHLAQATQANQPTVNAHGFNGRPTVAFDGTKTQSMARANCNVLGAKDHTVFAVMRVTGVVGTGDYYLANRSGGSNGFGILRGSSMLDFAYLGIQDHQDPVDPNGAGWRALAWRKEAGLGLKLRRNSTPATITNEADVRGATDPGAAAVLVIGADNSPANFPGSCEWAELVVYDRALSPGEVQLVEQYLGRKYGIGTGQSSWQTNNLIQYSNTFRTADSSVWSNSFVSVTPNTAEVADPFGGSAASLIQQDNTNNYSQIYQINFAGMSQFANGRTYTLSCWLRNKDRRYAVVYFQDLSATKNYEATFDLATGKVTNQSALVNRAYVSEVRPSGWYRACVEAVCPPQMWRVFAVLLNDTGGPLATHADAATKAVYAYNLQANPGSGPQPTTVTGAAIDASPVREIAMGRATI